MKFKTASISTPILTTFVSLGPVGYFILELLEGKIDRLLFLFIVSIAVTIVSTLTWVIYFYFKKSDKENIHKYDSNE